MNHIPKETDKMIAMRLAALEEREKTKASMELRKKLHPPKAAVALSKSAAPYKRQYTM